MLNLCEENIKLSSVPPSMPSEALSVQLLEIHSASKGIDGGTGDNFILTLKIQWMPVIRTSLENCMQCSYIRHAYKNTLGRSKNVVISL